jgi:hypothetical protein
MKLQKIRIKFSAFVQQLPPYTLAGFNLMTMAGGEETTRPRRQGIKSHVWLLGFL